MRKQQKNILGDISKLKINGDITGDENDEKID